jgi:hypothetical protein
MARLALAGTNTNYLGVSNDSSSYGADSLAAFDRAKFDSFLATQYPVLLQQLGQIGDEGYMNQQRDTARAGVARSLAGAGAQRDRQLRTLGLALSPEEQAVATKGDQLQAASADVAAFNRTTQQVKDREWQALTGTSSPMRSLRSAS